MKTALSVAILAVLLAGNLAAVPAGVEYTEGEASIRFKKGMEREAAIGDTLNTGDTVKTGFDGLVELDQKGVRLKINPDTVFTLMEKEQGGKTTGVLSLALGSVKFRYERLTGQEPLIQTNSCIAGVRGTELSVYAGVDGSALIVVDQGAVTVEAEGRSVELEPEEGVEVRPGEPPGDKFKVQRDQVDYSKWNEEKLRSFQEDPVAGIAAIRERMQYYVDSVAEYASLYSESNSQLAEERKKLAEITEKQGKVQANAYNKEAVFPLAVKTGNLFLNVRYFSLAALSLRRYVGGRIYVLMKSRHIAERDSPVYQEFSSGFLDLLSMYERSIVPHLVEEDI